MTLVSAARLLDSPPEEAFDRLTRLAARLLGAPVALVTLVGRRPGVLQERHRVCRSHGPAAAAPRCPIPSAVTSSRRGRRWWSRMRAATRSVRTNPAIRELSWIAYAGVPLTISDGSTVGALCVIDAHPRLWSPRDIALLEDLAASVVTEIEIRAPRPRLPGVQIPPPPVKPPVRDPAAGVFDVSALPMGLIRADGRWLRVNPALAELVGTSPEALTDCPADALTHPLDRGADAEGIRLLQAGECSSYASEKRLIRDGGETVWVVSTVTAVPDEDGTLDRFHVAMQDITDRKQAEQELRGREERYRIAAEASRHAVWDWDLLTDRLVWSEPEDGGFGYPRTPAGLSAAWWYERLHADDRERVVSGIHAAIARGATAWADAYRFRRADGGYAHVQDRGAIVRDEAGDAVRMIGALDDTTERIDVSADPAAPLGAIVGKDAALAKIASLFDEAKTHLRPVARRFLSRFTRDLPASTRRRRSCCSIARMKARTEVYRRQWASALTAIADRSSTRRRRRRRRSRADRRMSSRTSSGDAINPLFDPTPATLYVHPSVSTARRTARTDSQTCA